MGGECFRGLDSHMRLSLLPPTREGGGWEATSAPCRAAVEYPLRPPPLAARGSDVPRQPGCLGSAFEPPLLKIPKKADSKVSFLSGVREEIMSAAFSKVKSAGEGCAGSG